MPFTGDGVRIRRARSSDASTMTSLAIRSKAHWGYDAGFMRSIAPVFNFTDSLIANDNFYLLEDGVATLGFYRLRMLERRPFLEDLWIDPPQIGKGLGKQLWLHAVTTARGLGWDHFLIESDPFAVAFYLHMNALRVGEKRSASGRMLPLLRFEFEPVKLG